MTNNVQQLIRAGMRNPTEISIREKQTEEVYIALAKVIW